MRLYLSSYKFGNFTDELVKLVGDKKKVTVIANSRDWSTDKERAAKGLQEQIQILNSLGFSAEELDLRKYFGKKEALKKYLSTFGLVWVLGGNTFVLKRAYEQSGFDLIIKEMLSSDQIVYGGYSAGVVILSPSMKGLEIVDDPNVVPEGYSPKFNWQGLGLVNYNIAVHYRSDHPESALVEKEVEYLEKNKILYKTLRDGEVIIINGDKEIVLTVNTQKKLKTDDAKPKDVETIRSIVRASWIELYPNKKYGVTSEDLSVIDWYNSESLEKRRKEIIENQDTVHVWVVKDEDKIIGFCKALKFSDYGEIDAMYVLPEFQGKGLGKNLMQKAFEWLEPNLNIRLVVVKYNYKAIEFYKKMGFRETANKVIYTGTQLPSGKEIPRIEMIKSVES